jgi:hypothetical protein
MKLSKPTKFLLLWLAKRHPYGCTRTTSIYGAELDEQPKMTQLRGLVRRGWVREAREGNKPCGYPLGIFYITEEGLEVARTLLHASGIK